MKNLLLTLIMLVVASTLTSAQTQRFDANTKLSTVAWIGKKVIGSDHKGFVSISSATFQVDAKKKTITSGEIVIDMNSITCTDVQEKEWNDKLIAHLKSADFFDVTNNKTAKFTITNVVNAGSRQYQATGVMQIRGKSVQMGFPVQVTLSKDLLKVKVSGLKIDRTKFDVKYNSSSFFDNLKDKAIENEFILDINLTAELY